MKSEKSHSGLNETRSGFLQNATTTIYKRLLSKLLKL